MVFAAGFAFAVVNAHYKAQMVQEHLAARANTRVISEAPDILETGGGLKSALPLLGADPVYTLNSDAVWAGPSPLQALANAWDPARIQMLANERLFGLRYTGHWADVGTPDGIGLAEQMLAQHADI